MASTISEEDRKEREWLMSAEEDREKKEKAIEKFGLKAGEKLVSQGVGLMDSEREMGHKNCAWEGWAYIRGEEWGGTVYII